MTLYGIAEIGEALRVPRQLVASWYHRGKLPEPSEILKMGPVWYGREIEAWLEDRRRSQVSVISGGAVR